MSRSRPSCALAAPLLLALALAACSGRPLPLSAQAGGTVALPLAAETAQGGVTGYGGTGVEAQGLHDDQRGALEFRLHDPATGVGHVLVTRVVTRAWPDPASEVGLQGRVGPGFQGLGLAQLLALVDIPADVPPGEYEVRLRRLRRSESGPPEVLPAPVYGLRLAVLPARVGESDGAPTPFTAHAGAFSADASTQVAGLYPWPKLVLELPTPAPHAAEIVLSYPSDRIRLRGAFEEQHLGRGSIVALDDDAGAGLATLQLVDPAGSVAALALVFEPRAAFAAGRAAIGDFAVVSGRFYDAEGRAQAGAVVLRAIR